MPVLNEHLEHHVTQLLMQAGHLSSQRIEVSADGGTVTLSGEVQSFRRKLTAQRVAQSFTGVDAVINNLTVSPPEPITDQRIALEINERLCDGSNLVDRSIRVDARNGQVTLTGYVSNSREKEMAADIAASVDGVREIQDLLVVNPDRVLANEELCVAIGVAMNRIIGMDNEDIRISVVDEMARLSGNVDELWKKEAAEKTLRQFGILKVCNDIVVDAQ